MAGAISEALRGTGMVGRGEKTLDIAGLNIAERDRAILAADEQRRDGIEGAACGGIGTTGHTGEIEGGEGLPRGEVLVQQEFEDDEVEIRACGGWARRGLRDEFTQPGEYGGGWIVRNGSEGGAIVSHADREPRREIGSEDGCDTPPLLPPLLFNARGGDGGIREEEVAAGVGLEGECELEDGGAKGIGGGESVPR